MSKEKIDELRNSLTPSVGFELLMKNESLTKERDTYRDLCAELIEKMREIKMIVNSPLEAYYIASDSITKAEKILGESQ